MATTSAITQGSRQSIASRGCDALVAEAGGDEASPPPTMNCCSHRAETMSQVRKMDSGPPASICSAPAMAATKILRPPSRQAGSAASTTHGIHAKVAMWLGHMSRLSVKPLKEKAAPANAAAKLFPVQRRARKNIPSPANHKCSRQKKPNDHVSGSAR